MQIVTRRVHGFTLIELMMTMTVLAILIATAAPAFGNLIQSTEAQTSRSSLSTALGAARILAVSRTRHIVMCPSADQQYCGNTTEWQHGWLIFVDSNHDGARGTEEELLSVANAQPEGVAILTTSGRTRVDYRPDGSAPGSNATFTVCDRRGHELATSLVINNAGRVRSGTPTAAAAMACEHILDQPRA